MSNLQTFLATRAPDPAPIAILQPADPFLETAGEDLRRRIFITEAADGALKCLRPEFTIPICLHHMEGSKSTGRYAYGGTVFRQGREGPVEFQQAGLEDIGNANNVEADAACLADMLEALTLLGVKDPQVTLGDQNLFAVVVAKMKLPDALRQRLERNFGEPDQLQSIIDRMTDGGAGTATTEFDDLARAGDTAALTTKIEAMMKEAGLSPKAGRSAEDIAARTISRFTEAHFTLSSDQADILRGFLALEAPLENAANQLRDFATSAGLTFGAALDEFENRNDALIKRNVTLDAFTYRASFGRKLDYYTGMLFEVAASGGEALAGGGRYDRLCSLLGSDEPVQAVGFSITLDRLEQEDLA